MKGVAVEFPAGGNAVAAALLAGGVVGGHAGGMHPEPDDDLGIGAQFDQRLAEVGFRIVHLVRGFAAVRARDNLHVDAVGHAVRVQGESQLHELVAKIPLFEETRRLQMVEDRAGLLVGGLLLVE